ncbi:hypothetical protein ACC718_39225, partial [Rhizobium ruizarguesonis]
PSAELAGKNIKDGGDLTAGWDQFIAKPCVEQEIAGPDGQTYFSVAYPVKLTAYLNWYAVLADEILVLAVEGIRFPTGP